MQTLGQSFMPTSYPWREAQSQMNLTSVRQGRAAGSRRSTSGKTRTWDSEILRAVLNSGLGHMDGALASQGSWITAARPWGSNLMLLPTRDGQVVHIALSFLFLRSNHFNEVTGGC